MLNTTDSLDVADELIIILAKVIVIGIAAAYFDELLGLLLLLGAALAMLRTDAVVSSPDSQP